VLNDKDRRVRIKRFNSTAKTRMHKRLVFDSLQEVARNDGKNEEKWSIIVFLIK
jgi:hypothetical protein